MPDAPELTKMNSPFTENLTGHLTRTGPRWPGLLCSFGENSCMCLGSLVPYADDDPVPRCLPEQSITTW